MMHDPIDLDEINGVSRADSRRTYGAWRVRAERVQERVIGVSEQLA